MNLSIYRDDKTVNKASGNKKLKHNREIFTEIFTAH